MTNNDKALNDTLFLRSLDMERVRKTYVRIFALEKDETIITKIDGMVTTGSLTLDGSSNVRRTGSLTFIIDKDEPELNVRTFLSMNRKIKLLIGIENKIDNRYDDIIWFNQGIFVINSINLTHNTNSLTASVQIKDKMCLLNGDCGGALPAVVEFGSYLQKIGYEELNDFPLNPYSYICYKINNKYWKWDESHEWQEDASFYAEYLAGGTIKIKQNIFDIIRTLVCNYGGEDLGKIIINDVKKTFLNHAYKTTTIPYVYYNSVKEQFEFFNEEQLESATLFKFDTYEAFASVPTEYVYTGELTTGYGDTICSVLDKIKSLGNYEYFYDIEGNFIFQEVRNYLNTQYDPVYSNYDSEGNISRSYNTLAEGGSILNEKNYNMDLSTLSSSIYTFGDSDTFAGSPLISSYTNTPNYNNIKNDFHIWGISSSSQTNVIHYHIAIKSKPMPKYEPYTSIVEEGYEVNVPYPQYEIRKVKFIQEGSEEIKIQLDDNGESYVPIDWRAELYLQGLAAKQQGQRPDMHQQELLDYFDDIYDFKSRCFKKAFSANTKYWLDYIDSAELSDISIDTIGEKIYTYKQDKIDKMYYEDVIDIALIDNDMCEDKKAEYIELAKSSNKKIQYIDHNFYNSLIISTSPYSAQDIARNVLYQYTDYVAGISLTSVPIYYLEPNRRITVYDKDSEIYGDYIIKSINLSLDTKGTMTISASRAAQRL